MTQEVQSTLLTTENAPYQTWLDRNALASALSAGDVDLGPLNSSFMETPADGQQALAKLLGIPENVLAVAAGALAEWSGYKPALLT